ncbi:MAG: hypothetical protein KatS3mg039_0646 [Candidatus Kapaibacterium sp.]|nr:MAG: hypothetical protein KatS3mg039_0646 [Candidatus Kapabacteria bacterium]
MLSLEQVEAGHVVRIVRLAGSQSFVERMKELGLVYDTVVEVVRRSPLGRTIQLRYGTSHIALRLSRNHMIGVEPLHQQIASVQPERALDYVV